MSLIRYDNFIPLYNSTNIPALKAGQKIRYENDIFWWYEEFYVLSDTTVWQNPYSAPDKFIKPNNPYRITPLFALYAWTWTGVNTYKTEVYTVSWVRYIAIQNVSSSAWWIIIYNLDTKEEITTIALNNCQTICYSSVKNRLYAFLLDGTFRSYNHLWADAKTLTYEASAYWAISESLIISDWASCLIAISWKNSSNDMYWYIIPVDNTETVWTIIKSSALATSLNHSLYVQATWDSENNIYTAMLGSWGSNRVVKFVYDSWAWTFTWYVLSLGAWLLGNVSYTGWVIVWDNLYLNWSSQISVQPKDTLAAWIKDSYIYWASIVNNNLVYLPAFNRILTIRRDISNWTTNNLIIFSPDNPYDLYVESINASDVVGIDTVRHYVFIYSINSKVIWVYKY